MHVHVFRGFVYVLCVFAHVHVCVCVCVSFPLCVCVCPLLSLFVAVHGPFFVGVCAQCVALWQQKSFMKQGIAALMVMDDSCYVSKRDCLNLANVREGCDDECVKPSFIC